MYSKTSFQFILWKWHCCSSGSSYCFHLYSLIKKNVIGLKQNPEAACSPEEVSVKHNSWHDQKDMKYSDLFYKKCPIKTVLY